MARVQHSKHGMSGHRLNKIWRHIRQRCYNPNDQAYHNYGEKGITVCQEWNESFEPFRKWALANGYQDDLTLDRIDSSGNYEPRNCQWISKAENTRKSQVGRKGNRGKQESFIEFNGQKLTVKQWADSLGISTVALRYRLKSAHWTLEQALTSKSGDKPRAEVTDKRVAYKGREKTLAEWAKETGIPRNILYQRLFKMNWSAERAFTSEVREKQSS